MHTKLTGVLRCVKGLDPPTQAVPTEANGIGRGVPREKGDFRMHAAPAKSLRPSQAILARREGEAKAPEAQAEACRTRGRALFLVERVVAQ